MSDFAWDTYCEIARLADEQRTANLLKVWELRGESDPTGRKAKDQALKGLGLDLLKDKDF